LVIENILDDRGVVASSGSFTLTSIVYIIPDRVDTHILVMVADTFGGIVSASPKSRFGTFAFVDVFGIFMVYLPTTGLSGEVVGRGVERFHPVGSTTDALHPLLVSITS
jgi:hypothetical protein